MANRRLTESANNLSLIEGSDGKKRHLVLFYENAKSAMNIECHFIKSGLSNGEYCIFTTYKSANSLAKKLTNFGIDVDRFKKRNLLDVCKIIELEKDPHGVKNEIKRINDFLQKSDLPKRIVGSYVWDILVKNDVDANIAAEKSIHSNFADLNGSILCPYPFKQVPLQERAQWMIEMLKNHHVAIFVDRSGQSQVIEM